MKKVNLFVIAGFAALTAWSGPVCHESIEDFVGAFENLSICPKTMIVSNIRRFEQSGGHLQGIQLYSENGKDFAFLSGSSANQSYMVKVDLSPPAKVMAIDKLMPDPFRHAGGFQIYDRFLAVGIEDNIKRNVSQVRIYDIGGNGTDWNSPLYTIHREGDFESATAGAVGITAYKDIILLAVANWNSRNIDFYACPIADFKAKQGEFQLIGTVTAREINKENWSDTNWWSYQNINLFTDASKSLYLTAYARDDRDLHLADLYQVSQVSEKNILIRKIQTKSFETSSGVDFRAGSGISIQRDGSLVLAACPYQLEEKTTLNIYLPEKNTGNFAPLNPSENPLRAWELTGELAAEEAVQAAAASKTHVYAIKNRQVAQYDRFTGEKTAVSSGNAVHLNSGFFWEEQLFIAHSNYPGKPDSSDIRVLDPKDMQLRTFKDFGESEGSLTWALRIKGDWWCMWAYYGDQNHKSYLARYDDDWQETERFFFPNEVLSLLGKMSISGGVWKDGGFWVSGHDERELYLLKVPGSGNVLTYITTAPAPFSGQGIAEDPLNGGLVGIDRRSRKILFAEQTIH